MWIFCYFGSAILLLTGIFFAFLSEKRCWRQLRPTLFLAGFTYLSAAIAFYPFYRVYFGEAIFPLRAIILSLHNTIRLFVIDCDFDFIKEGLVDLGGTWATAYSVLFSILYIACPLLTFGFILSFFKNVSAYRRLYFTFGRDLYVFSELNPKNLSLAQSLKNADRRRIIIFANVDEDDSDTDDTLLDGAHAIGAILFKAEITSIHIPARSHKSKIYFIVQGDDEKLNLSYALALTKARANIHHNEQLFFFDTTAAGNVVFANPQERKLIVRHINPKQALIYDKLFREGIDLFKNASAPDKNGERLICALIVGLGGYGSEMFKALSWVCQMNGYRLKVVGMDKDKARISAFRQECPGLFDPAVNLKQCPGEAQFSLHIVEEETDVTAHDFENKVLRYAPDATYVFVSLGDDDRNVAAAGCIRQIYERNRSNTTDGRNTGHPQIETIVYNPELSIALENARNHKKLEQQIHYFGALDKYFSEQVFFNSDLEQAALKINEAYQGTPDDFYYCDYNYRSSLASAIHKKLRRDCEMPGTDLPKDERTAEQMEQLAILEHRRWSAYMRSEGYRYGGSEATKAIDTLAKIHYCLVPFDQLSEKDKHKDYVVL